MPFRSVSPLPCLLLALSLTGCGVSDYEKKMLEAQVRLQRFEEEKKLLGPPLNIPTTLDENKVPVPVARLFLRPPVGISPQADNAAQPRGQLFYSYRPDKGPAAGPFALVEVAFATAGREPEFAAEVLRAFTATGGATTRTQQLRVPGRSESLTFQTTEFEDGQFAYSVNLWRGPKRLVAVAYWMPRDQKGQARRAIELSLGTIALDGEAQEQRRAYERAAAGQLLRPPEAAR